MHSMNGSIIPLPGARSRDRRLTRAAEARRRLRSAPRGRAWINGREVGGTDARFRHLSATHD